METTTSFNSQAAREKSSTIFAASHYKIDDSESDMYEMSDIPQPTTPMLDTLNVTNQSCQNKTPQSCRNMKYIEADKENIITLIFAFLLLCWGLFMFFVKQ